MEGHSSNPVAKQLNFMSCVLVKGFVCVYIYIIICSLFCLAIVRPRAGLIVWDVQSPCKLRFISISHVLASFSAKHCSINTCLITRKFPFPSQKQCPDTSMPLNFVVIKKHLSYDLLLFSSNYNLRPI